MPTPQSEFERQSNAINANIDMINKSWKELQQKYKKQLKDEPDSWVGIGKASELGDLVEKSNEFGTLIYHFNKR